MDLKIPTLVYKRDHHGDPDEDGVFGCNDCMGQVREWPFRAVIGIGGIGPAVAADITGRINWIGIGPHRRPAPPEWEYRGPLVTFDRFVDCNSLGWMVRLVAPHLASRMYGVNVRATMTFDSPTWKEIQQLLHWAASNAGPSPAIRVVAPMARRLRCRPVGC
jgi:hypothetical protein